MSLDPSAESAGRADVGPRLAALVVGVAPALCLIYVWGVSRKIVIGWGVIAWVVGVMLKWAIYQAVVVRILHRRLSAGWLATAQGAVSAFSELSAALVVLVYVLPRLTPLEVAGFGAGAAFVEGILVAVIPNPHAGGPVGEHVDRQADILRREKRGGYWWLGVADRAIADVAQICARGLVYASLSTSNPLPGAFALVTFAAIDGFGYYALVQRWEFAQSRVGLKLYGTLGVVAGLQAVAFALAV